MSEVMCVSSCEGSNAALVAMPTRSPLMPMRTELWRPPLSLPDLQLSRGDGTVLMEPLQLSRGDGTVLMEPVPGVMKCLIMSDCCQRKRRSGLLQQLI